MSIVELIAWKWFQRSPRWVKENHTWLEVATMYRAMAANTLGWGYEDKE